MLVKPCAVYCAVQGILSSVGRVFKGAGGGLEMIDHQNRFYGVF